MDEDDRRAAGIVRLQEEQPGAVALERTDRPPEPFRAALPGEALLVEGDDGPDIRLEAEQARVLLRVREVDLRYVLDVPRELDVESDALLAALHHDRPLADGLERLVDEVAVDVLEGHDAVAPGAEDQLVAARVEEDVEVDRRPSILGLPEGGDEDWLRSTGDGRVRDPPPGRSLFGYV